MTSSPTTDIGPKASDPNQIENPKLDLDSYVTQTKASPPQQIALEQLDPDDATALTAVGVHASGEQRSGTIVVRDFHPVCVQAETTGLELLPIAFALKKYDWLKERYVWQAVPPDTDEVSRQLAQVQQPAGFFIRVAKGAKVTYPCQAALLMASTDIAQQIHNVVVLEEDSELNLITGCLTHMGVQRGLHLAISEQYIGKNATLTNTMVHSWGPEVIVRPRSGTIIDAGGKYISNYVSLRPAKSIQTHPKTWLNGVGASAKYLTVILGSDGSTIETGGEVYLNAEDTSAELVHRGVCTGGQMHQTGLLIGNAPCRAHIDCAGMVMNAGRKGFIISTPGLKALHPEARMSHEASVGKIAPAQVEYLQSRGFEEHEAISMIIRGFLEADVEGLGNELDARIAEIAELAGHGES